VKVVVLGAYARSLVNFRGRLIEGMVATGHEVVACATGAEASAAKALAELGAHYVPVALERTGLNPLRDVAGVVALVRLLRHLEPDLLLAYTAKPSIYGAFAARWAGVARVFTMIEGLGHPFGEGDGSWRRRCLRLAATLLYRRALAASTATFVLNPDDRDDLLRWGIAKEHRIEVIDGAGVDLEHFAPAPIARPPPTFLMIARLIREKGVADFVEAAARVKARHSNARFLVLGRIEDHPGAIREAEIRAWHEAGHIEYLGATDDVRPYLRGCTALVLPSYYREGLPRTILEAMATGRPIITTDTPGCRETVVPGVNGFLVPARDPEALAGAVERIILDPGLTTTMGRRSREMAEARFDVRKVNAAMLSIMGLL
jgi:glycosyltransferase involved in cell wall biosynthesis